MVAQDVAYLWGHFVRETRVTDVVNVSQVGTVGKSRHSVNGYPD